MYLNYNLNFLDTLLFHNAGNEFILLELVNCLVTISKRTKRANILITP